MATASSIITGLNSDHSYYASSNTSNANTDSTSTTYARLTLTRGSGANTYAYWEFSVPTIPTGATIGSITCNYKARVSNTNTSYVASADIQMCSGTTTKGTAQSILTTSTDASTISSPGTWTVAEINAGIKLKTTATRGTSNTSTNYYIYFYGADISISYVDTSGNTVYIKVGGSWVPSDEFYIKDNGSWLAVDEVYKKASGAWSQQTYKSALFQPSSLYLKADKYEENNCVFKLDGIYAYNTGLVDGYIQAEYISNPNVYFEDVVMDGTSFVFNGTSAWMRPSASAPFDAFLFSSHTVEMYFEPAGYDTSNEYRTTLYMPRKANCLCLYLLGNANLSQWCVATAEEKVIIFNSWPALNQKHYVALNADGFMLDGTYFSYANWNSYTTHVYENNIKNVSDGAYTCASIGCRWRSNTGTQNFNGKMYAFRVHNTKLTESQMRNNMECDRNRFNT